MKKSFAIFSFLAASVFCHANDRVVTIESNSEFAALKYDEEWRLYLPDEETPFSGKLYLKDFGPGPRSGNLSELNFLNGREEGYQVIWRSEAKEIPQYEWYAKNGFRDGLFISYTYYPSGAGYEPMKNLVVNGIRHYKNGYQNGYAITYFRDGTLRSRFNYVEGVKNGMCGLWNEQNEVIYSGKFYKGIRDDEWTIRQDDGSYHTIHYDGEAMYAELLELAEITEEEYLLAQQLETKYDIYFDRMPSQLREKAFKWWPAISNAKNHIKASSKHEVID